jgi:hypothetical protein
LGINLDQELATAICAAENLYGERDKRFALKPVEHHAETYAQTKVDDTAFTLTVYTSDLSNLTKAAAEAEAKYQLWHEAVHCLFPVNRMDTLWFEEGVALRFGLKHTPVLPKQLIDNRKALSSPWKDVYKAFKILNPSEAQIREIRERAPGRLLDNVDADIVTNVCNIRYKFCAPLFQRLSPNSR